jgi:hypothetical protein
MIKNIPNAVNKIQEINETEYGTTPEFEIEIRKNGKIVYRNKAYAGILNFVQSKCKINFDTKEIHGDSQVFSFGHPVKILFAFDQLRLKLKKSKVKPYGLNVMEVASRMLKSRDKGTEVF